MPRRPPQMHARAKYDFGNMLSKNWTFTIAQNVTVLEIKILFTFRKCTRACARHCNEFVTDIQSMN